jgi:two-component system, chemotaxis family, sensor kinase CheA
MTDRESLITDFLVESTENLDRLDEGLILLEEQPERSDVLADIFRTIHTIKGTCGFLEFSRLERLTHAGENLLSLMRDGKLTAGETHMTALLQMVDAVRGVLAHVEEHLVEPEHEDLELIELLTALADERETRAAEREEAVKEDPLLIGNVLVEAGLVEPEALEAALEAQASGDDRIVGEILVEEAQVRAEKVAAAAKLQEIGREQVSRASQSSLRIQVEQLDGLMNLVGELVLVRNQVLQQVAQSEDAASVANAHRLDHITTDLQEGIMKVRMQPIGHLWSRVPRVVRDLSKSLGKQVRIVMDGKETELDKSVLEAITDPLTHLVRNAIDHGLETPEQREAAGKPAEGIMKLRAYHESGHVGIEISDDGHGLDVQRIGAKAVQRGLISEAQAREMSDRELTQLVFAPGFSTAAAVTKVSGRGVGMDVVKTNIEKIGGIVDITTTLGKGTTVRIKIPLTLAIVPALIVSCGGDRYAIPQVSLVELVRLEGENAARGVEYVHGSPVHRLRGQLLPLVFLSEQLGVEAVQVDEEPAINVVVLQADNQQFGLLVDDINDTEEIVVKPLDTHLKGTPIYAGTTIMGDGRVALILDVLGVAQQANVVGEGDRLAGRDDSLEEDANDDRETFLIFQVDEQRRTAIPLNSVYRLEEVRPESIEYAGSQPVTQYRDQIMPLVDVRGVLGLPPVERGDDEFLQVVVHESEGRAIGLVVDQISDIIEEQVRVRRGGAGQGLRESVVLGGQVTDVVDLESLLQSTGDTAQEAPSQLDHENPDEAAKDTLQVCTFRLGEHLFGVDVHRVQEVLRYQDMTSVPMTSSTVRGLINLRGQTVTALDLRERLHLPPREQPLDEEQRPMNVVLMAEGGVASVLVDEIGDVLEVEACGREDVPETVDSSVREVLCSVYKLPGDLLLLLDIDKTVGHVEPAIA